MCFSLIISDRELTTVREHLDVELETLRNNVDEQKAHIDILDEALDKAQETQLKLEEEVRTEADKLESASHDN